MNKTDLHTKYTREDALNRKIEFLYNTSKMTDNECRELYDLPKKTCLKNLIKRLAEMANEL